MTEPGLAARRAALTMIQGALERRGGLDEALGASASLEPRDRAFARQLAMTTLRRLGQIDRILAERVAKPPPLQVTLLLRIGLAQLLFMHVPDHAAVASSVELADGSGATRPFKGLVNAVLRGARRRPPALRDEDLAPSWLLARWRAAYGGADADAIAALIAAEPRTDLTLRDPSQAGAIAGALQGEVLEGGSVRAGLSGDVTLWPGFAEGQWWVQDAAAAVPARLLGAVPGLTALDLCAAPGGKTLQLAAAGARVTALDRSPSRLRRLQENLARTGLSAEVAAAPAEDWDDPRTFDLVLLDAPCASTGTYRRQPEVLWLAAPGEIAKLAAVQARLLDAAARRVRPGGRLVYCVCSLEPEEGEGQVEAFLRRQAGFSVMPVGAGEGGSTAASLTEKGALRMLPHHRSGGQDGFFAVRFVRG